MKILIIRFSSIGDIVLTTPVMRCVHQQLPEAEIHYLTKASFASLLLHNPHVHKVHTLSSDWVATMAELRAEGFDLIIDLHKNIRSKRVARAIGVESIRFRKLNTRKFLMTRWRLDLLPSIHLVDRYFNALAGLGVRNDGKGLEMYLPSELDQLPTNYGLRNGTYTVYALGGTYATKRLPNHKTVELIRKLPGPVVLVGGPEDRKNEEQILTDIQDPRVQGLSGKLDLLGSAALIRHARHVISHDSGMMHIASAFHTPLSVIWGNTHPKLGMYAYGYPPDVPVFNHQVELGCRPCSKLGFKSCPQGHFHCMEKQNVEDIVKKSLSVDPAQ